MEQHLRKIHKLNKKGKSKISKTRFEKLYNIAYKKYTNMEKKNTEFSVRYESQLRRRKMRAYFRTVNLLKSFLSKITEEEDQQKFIEKYQHLFVKDVIYVPTVTETLTDIKMQKILRRKKFKILSIYKWKRLDQENKSRFWDLFFHRKIQQKGSCSFVGSHSKEVYTLKRVFKFFYGYLKNKVWKKAYYKSQRKNNKLLYFLNFLENRLVVVLYRMNLVTTLMQGKQFIRHGFVKVNNRYMPYPNYQIKKNDMITLDKEMFFKYLIGNNKVPFEFMSSSVVKPELPHLYVKHRLFKGVFLYDPLNNYNVLAKQYPDFFFGKNKVRYQNINLHKITKNSRNLKAHMDKKNFFDRIYRVSPFIEKYNELFSNENTSVPVRSVRLILSYFLKV